MLLFNKPKHVSSVFIHFLDMEKHAWPLSWHTAGIFRERVLLQWGHAGVFLWQRPWNVSAHSKFLSDREAALSQTWVHPGLWRGAGLLRNSARDHRGLLHGGKTAASQKTDNASFVRKTAESQWPPRGIGCWVFQMLRCRVAWYVYINTKVKIQLKLPLQLLVS